MFVFIFDAGNLPDRRIWNYKPALEKSGIIYDAGFCLSDL